MDPIKMPGACWMCATYTFTIVQVSLATFACYLLLSEENQLNPQKTFICLALFEVLKVPAVMFPEAVARLITVSTFLICLEPFIIMYCSLKLPLLL